MIMNTKTLLDLVYELRCDLIQKANEWGIEVDPRFTETKETEHKNFVDRDGFMDSSKQISNPILPIELNEDLPDTAEVMKALLETVAKSEAYLHGLYTMNLSLGKIPGLKSLHEKFMENGKRNLGALKKKIDRKEVDDEKFNQLIDRLLVFTTDVKSKPGSDGSLALDFLHLNDLPFKAIVSKFLKDETTNDKVKYPNGQPVNYEYGQQRHKLLVDYLKKAKVAYDEHAAERAREAKRQEVEAQRLRQEQEFQSRQAARAAEFEAEKQQRAQAAEVRAEKRAENKVKLEALEGKLKDYQKVTESAHMLRLAFQFIDAENVDNIDPNELAPHFFSPSEIAENPNCANDKSAEIRNQLKTKAGRKQLQASLMSRNSDLLLTVATSAEFDGNQKAKIIEENLKMDHEEAMAEKQALLDEAEFQRQNAVAEQQRKVAELQAEQELKVLEMKDKFAQEKMEAEQKAFAKSEAAHKREIEAMNMRKVDMWKGIPKPAKGLLITLMVLTFPISLPIYAVVKYFRKQEANAKADKFLLASAIASTGGNGTSQAAGTDEATPATNLATNLQDVMANLRARNPGLGQQGANSKSAQHTASNRPTTPSPMVEEVATPSP